MIEFIVDVEKEIEKVELSGEYRLWDVKLNKMQVLIDFLLGIIKVCLQEIWNFGDKGRLKSVDHMFNVLNYVRYVDGLWKREEVVLKKIPKLFFKGYRFMWYKYYKGQIPDYLFLANVVYAYCPLQFKYELKKEEKTLFFRGLASWIREKYEKFKGMPLKFAFYLYEKRLMKDERIKGLILFISYFDLWWKNVIVRKKAENVNDEELVDFTNLWIEEDHLSFDDRIKVRSSNNGLIYLTEHYVEQESVNKIFIEQVSKVLNSFEKEVFEKIVCEGYKITEFARIYGKPVDSVKKTFYDVKNKVRKLLNSEVGNGERKDKPAFGSGL